VTKAKGGRRKGERRNKKGGRSKKERRIGEVLNRIQIQERKI